MIDTPEHVKNLIQEHERRLQKLKLQVAKFGSVHAPVYLLTEIEDTEAQVAGLWRQLGERPAVTLPLEIIPDIGTLPRGSRMPFTPNPLFVGREEDLKALARLLKVGEVAALGQIAAATGLGGIGKTQLATEFVHRYGQYFSGGVFWLSFTDGATVASEVAACGGPAGLGLYTEASGLKQDEQVQMVMAAWQSSTPRLLVFDNCEEEELLAAWRPRTGGCRVLMTSRRPHWDEALGVQTLALGMLNRGASIELLRKLTGSREEGQRREKEEQVLGKIAAELGDLPLALHVAGSFLKAYKGEISPGEYLTELRGEGLLQHESLAGVKKIFSPTNHELHVGRTFALSYDRLDATNPDDALALALLGRAAYFALGEPIPRELLLLTVELSEGKGGRRQASRALKRLVELGLLEGKGLETVRLHRLVAHFGREVAGGEVVQAAVEKVVLNEVSEHLDQAGYLAQLGLTVLHLRAVAEAAWMRRDEQAARLCIWLGYYLNQTGDYGTARPYYERALAICEEVFGPLHPDTATSLNNLALLLKAQGDYEAARPYYERALTIREAVLGPQHPDTAGSLNNLAALLQAQGNYEAARPYYERALAICEEVRGPQHPLTAISLNNLALLFRAQKDYAAARPYFERALAITEEVLGVDHPDTARSLNNLGSLLQALDEPSLARQHYERALAIWEAMQGSEHPDKARILNNLGSLLRTLGEPEMARLCFERALVIYEKVLRPEHPDTATSLWWMGVIAREAGEVETARTYYQRALAIYEKVLGPEHPHTRIVQDKLTDLPPEEAK